MFGSKQAESIEGTQNKVMANREERTRNVAADTRIHPTGTLSSHVGKEHIHLSVVQEVSYRLLHLEILYAVLVRDLPQRMQQGTA